MDVLANDRVRTMMIDLVLALKKKEYIENTQALVQDIQKMEIHDSFVMEILTALRPVFGVCTSSQKKNLSPENPNVVLEEEKALPSDFFSVYEEEWTLLKKKWEDCSHLLWPCLENVNQILEPHQLYRQPFVSSGDFLPRGADFLMGFFNKSREKNLFLDLGYRKLTLRPLELVPALSTCPIWLSCLPLGSIKIQKQSHSDFEVIYASFSKSNNEGPAKDKRYSLLIQNQGYVMGPDGFFRISKEEPAFQEAIPCPFYLDRRIVSSTDLEKSDPVATFFHTVGHGC